MLTYRTDVILRHYTTLKTGGFAKLFVTVHSFAELREACQYAHQNNLPVLILGGGSNMLVADDGFPGLVIRLQLTGYSYTPVAADTDRVYLEVQAGEVLDDVVAKSIKDGWYGVENL